MERPTRSIGSLQKQLCLNPKAEHLCAFRVNDATVYPFIAGKNQLIKFAIDSFRLVH